MMTFTDYANYDALGLAELIRNGEVSAEEVLETAIERTEAVNGTINAVVCKMYDQARQAIAGGLPDGPFRGVPFMLKDLGLFCAGVPLSNGSRLFQDFVPPYDATLTERYRAAGLVIMAKTNTPEFGICATTEPQLHGPTRNPWNPAHSAGGSSGGSAAAVAARILPMAHATDGGGSIRIPAANCGLFGFKPSRGYTPFGPDLGESLNGMACGHCVSHSVRDSAALLDATYQSAVGDPYAAPAALRRFREEIGTDPGRLRIALLTTTLDGTPVHPECVKATENAARLCSELGHVVEPARPPVSSAEVAHVWRVLSAPNVWNTINIRTQALGRDLSPDDVEPITWLWIQEGKNIPATEFARAIQLMHGIGRRLGNFLQDYDLVLSSTMANPPLPLGHMAMTGSDLEAYYQELMKEIPFTPLFNISGGAAMSVPLHWSDDGLPVGVHFGGALGDEPVLFRLAAQLEQAQPWHRRRPV
jgi:amidase/6-aminohexanoate-cyclic-dimer hydrolase